MWPAVAADATPIRKIHVSDQGRFGFARVDAAELGLPAIGYVVPNRGLGGPCGRALSAAAGVEVFCPAEVAARRARREPGTGMSPGGEARPRIRTRLIVAADGAHSAVRRVFGVESDVRDYGQTAVITTVLPQRFHDHVAYERFTESGPLALLPLADGRCTLVLTLAGARVEAALGWPDAEFLAEVQRRFGFRLGRFLKVGRRTPYPLTLSVAERTSAGRCVIIGNAAQGLHPVAGMGFNLGLRDVASLAELIAEQPAADAGDPHLLAAYDAWRADDRARDHRASPMGWCACSPTPSVRAAGPQPRRCSPSTCCRRPKRRCPH